MSMHTAQYNIKLINQIAVDANTCSWYCNVALYQIYCDTLLYSSISFQYINDSIIDYSGHTAQYTEYVTRIVLYNILMRQ